MQMFGVGILELMVILILTVIVVGPDRMPQVAADLARWIRQTRAYAKHLMGDFNEVIADLEKEAGASREDWKEIASVITRHTGAVGQELTRFTKEVEASGDLSEAKAEPSNVVSIESQRESTPNGAEASNGESTHEAETETARAEEKPWYVPERATRRRSSE
jgi:sec-independent protein translocase protein TatB